MVVIKKRNKYRNTNNNQSKLASLLCPSPQCGSLINSSMPIDLYYLLISPPCRAVMLTAEAVGVKLNLKELDIFKGEQMKPEFVALNPQHCIPTLVDGDFVILPSLQFPVMFQGEKELNPDKLARLQEALGWLDGFLSGHKFAAGDNITIADHILLATVSTIKEADVDLSKHANILAWLEKCKAEVPGYETNQKGAEDWGKFFKSRCNLHL
uniref:GST N-terminal domain-containing protein n=2 Tax=Scylla olivacea TaxID=85551 RepID=A0A0P4W863_SCYOL